jgi:hypothetical protein
VSLLVAAAVPTSASSFVPMVSTVLANGPMI